MIVPYSLGVERWDGIESAARHADLHEPIGGLDEDRAAAVAARSRLRA